MEEFIPLHELISHRILLGMVENVRSRGICLKLTNGPSPLLLWLFASIPAAILILFLTYALEAFQILLNVLLKQKRGMLKVVVVMEIIGEKRVDVQNILFSLSGIKRVQHGLAILCLFVIEAQLAFQICLHVDLMVEHRGLEKN